MDLSYGTVCKVNKTGKVKFKIFFGAILIIAISLFLNSYLHDIITKPKLIPEKSINTGLQKINEINKTVPEIQKINEISVTVPVSQKDPKAGSISSAPLYLYNPPSTLPAPAVKVAYLTFDDGPSKKITPQVLEILYKENIKANFFVIGELCKYNPEIVKAENEQGHTVCNHTYSHDYKKLYSSPLALLADIKKCDEMLKSTLGESYNSRQVRLPGGGYGKKYASFKQLMSKENYTYVYWDVESGDAEGQNVSVEKQLNTIKSEVEQDYISKKDEIVILMHDSFNKETTLQALPGIIQYLRGKGYAFKTFSGTVSN